ncbi:hypothetical protein CCP1ISM_10140001 [Azospirillaceae bacterium]
MYCAFQETLKNFDNLDLTITQHRSQTLIVLSNGCSFPINPQFWSTAADILSNYPTTKTHLEILQSNGDVQFVFKSGTFKQGDLLSIHSNEHNLTQAVIQCRQFHKCCI